MRLPHRESQNSALPNGCRGELLAWAEKCLAKKNTLLEADAQSVETAYEAKCNEIGLSVHTEIDTVHKFHLDYADPENGEEPTAGPAVNAPDPEAERVPIPKEVRRRDKAHLLFVRDQPCLVCKQTPCDAHHLKFAQQRALGRKVSDEFAVPLCRAHHQQLHRHGNERAWWANLQIAPLSAAKELWDTSQADPPVNDR